MRLIQFETTSAVRHVGIVEGERIQTVLGCHTTRELALAAIAAGRGLLEEVLARGSEPGPLDARDIGRIVEKYATAAGLPPELRGAHVLRHTFASHFVMNGGNILTLQRILGHANVTMTMRYAHMSPDHLQEAKNLNPLSRLTLC